VLRVHKLGLSGREVEKASIKELDALDSRLGTDMARMLEQRRISAEGYPFLIAEEVYALYPFPQVPPELINIARARETCRHAHNSYL
jgi:hypothetical protein